MTKLASTDNCMTSMVHHVIQGEPSKGPLNSHRINSSIHKRFNPLPMKVLLVRDTISVPFTRNIHWKDRRQAIYHSKNKVHPYSCPPYQHGKRSNTMSQSPLLT